MTMVPDKPAPRLAMQPDHVHVLVKAVVVLRRVGVDVAAPARITTAGKAIGSSF
jgi:hypothetical protein